MTDEELVKDALAELTFKAVEWAVSSMQLFQDPAYDPLRDCIIEVRPYSSSKALVKVAGYGKVQWFNLVLQKQKD